MTPKIITLTAGLLLLGVSFCGKDPLKPPAEQKKSYVLYVGNWFGDEVTIVSTDSNSVIDTIQGFDENIWELSVTH
ncbi:MAG: hypothetical protein IH972_06370, partial [Candidatus Marinimicrobia bacterium]|nr:hypothetical protein [Candidatus Neomarinimicrobiota bacterium]